MKDNCSLREIWIFAEATDAGVSGTYYELLTKAKELTQNLTGMDICAVVAGASEEVIQTLLNSGVDSVYCATAGHCAYYSNSVITAALTMLITKYRPQVLLMPASSNGSEIAPSVAIRVKTGVAAHCVDMTMDEEGKLTCLVPAFGGKQFSEILIPTQTPQMATVRPGIFSASSFPKKPLVRIIRENVSVEKNGETFVRLEGKNALPSILNEADIVLCAGRGVSDENTFTALRELAGKLHACVGYTRSFADLGYVEDETNMIGASGVSVHPKVYVGFGVSGASHHVSGIQKSRSIVSVNRDGHAKMRDFSDYYATCDASAIINEMNKKL